MKRILIFIFSIFLLISCGKTPHIKIHDITIDGKSQTVAMEATPSFDIYLLWGWSNDEDDVLVKDNYPLNETPWVSDFVGDWFEVHTDRENHQLARLTVSENNSGLSRKLTIEIQFKGMSDSVTITQYPL